MDYGCTRSKAKAKQSRWGGHQRIGLKRREPNTGLDAISRLLPRAALKIVKRNRKALKIGENKPKKRRLQLVI
jgi:hypothetical protein